MGTGRVLIILGIVLLLVGVVVHYTNFFSWFTPGRLPGDFRFRRGNVSVYVPFATCVVLSILLSFILYIIRK
jgi:hypothetical protein